MVTRNPPDTLCVVETWFTVVSDTTLRGYVPYKNDRGMRGGGVCIYVRSEILSVEEFSVETGLRRAEQVWCGIKRGKDSILIGCVYRSPDLTYETSSEILTTIKRARNRVVNGEYSLILVFGDFNHPETL